MRLDTRREGAAVVVTLAGELDLTTAPLLREALIEQFSAGCHQLVVDMQDVTFVDSTGLGVLVGGLNRASLAQGTLQVVCTSPDVVRIFTMTGLEKLLALHASVPEAVAALAG